MSAASSTRLGLAIAACVGVLVLAILWDEVPAVIEPCSSENLGGSEQPYSMGTCLRRPSAVVIILKLTISFFAVAAVAVLAAMMASKRTLIAGGTAAALSGLIGLTTVQALSAQVFDIGYLPTLDAAVIVSLVFFLFGAFVVWGWRKWWPNNSLERTRER
jgi:hypothetical protein